MLREFVNERAEKYLTTLHQRDEETGLDYRGARYYDSDVARFLSLDPAQAEFISWSPYNYVLGNPLSMIDPDGRSAGDYYSSTGAYLGSDGKKDDKVYVADRKNKDGTFQNAQDLGITHSTFLSFAGMVYNEDRSTQQSAYGIASAMMNYRAFKNANGGNVTVAGLLSGTYSSAPKTLGTGAGADLSRAAAINALQGGTDYSNGATHWDGFDFAARGTTSPKGVDQGFDISQPHLDAFRAAWTDQRISAFSGGSYTTFSTTLTAGPHAATATNPGRVLYKSTAVEGNTIFWGPNQNANYSWKCEVTGIQLHSTPNSGYNWRYY